MVPKKGISTIRDKEPAVRLVQVTRRCSDGLIEMAQEYRDAGEFAYQSCLEHGVESFFAEVDQNRGVVQPPERVQQDHYWLLRGDRILGSSRLRHTLIPRLELDGGNIGYEVRPSERGQGLGTLLLSLTLREARRIGLSRALLTAVCDNAASIAVILQNDGRFTDTTISTRTGKTMNRYWIELD